MKCSVSRKNRDRKGGHELSVLSKGMEGWAYCTGVERSLVKKLTKKKIRRQHKMTMVKIGLELSNDYTFEDRMQEEELEELLLSHQNWLDYQEEDLAAEYEDPLAYYYDDPYNPWTWDGLDDDDNDGL